MFSKKLKKNIYFQFLFVFFFLLNCAYAQEYEKTEIADFIMEHFLLSMLITILLIILAVGFIWANVFNNKLRKLNYALKEKEFKYRALVENVHIGIYRNTPYDGGKFEQANSFMAHMFGFDSIEELCSVKVSSLYQNPKDRDKFLEKIRKFGFVKDEELFLKRKDGKNIIVSVTASAYFDKNDNIDYLDGVIEDITERKKIQEQTKNLADDWARTFDAISDFLFIQDPDFVITHVNKALCDALHIKKEEVIGKKCFQVLHKSKKPWPGCPFEKTRLDKGTHTEEVDDPEIGIPLLITTSPIFNETGEFLGSVHIAKNITVLKNTEAELQKKFYDLERFQKIAVDRELRMKELKEKIKELEERLKNSP